MSDAATPGEFELIRRYFMQDVEHACSSDHVSPSQARAGIVLGQGDDCALLSPSPGRRLAVSVDTSLADVHFPRDASAEAIGHRALAVNLSDLAAMGARPRWFVLALTLPDVDEQWLEGFARGLYGLAREHDIALVGGDITRGQELSITITVHGEVDDDSAITRHGARPGDLLAVTGTLGSAHGGLRAWFNGQRDERHPLVAAYLRPAPRIKEAMSIQQRVSAGLDISDGLLADLGHLCARSGVGACLDATALPLDQALVASLGEHEALEAALNGGDDYELLLALDPEQEDAVRQALETLGGALHVIGRVTSEPGISGVASTGRGWQHFHAADHGTGASP
ncbi:thiamine-phosphate kinase [Kushneria indalinina]|uniref:Thiamine-monophosphate kinase n=1 Tax=Kushneria indalinina DSM 14324 TaxID=1122140 RepID=A0A3D9DU79_9GAMM|nr:thiamine-phosphate kinase [Kushneria indalinina]REC94316.1 thiamine-phosphate kinase [Kushneria indalinina DSM 14324]